MQAIEEYCVFIRDSLANKEAILMHTMYQGFPPPGFWKVHFAWWG